MLSFIYLALFMLMALSGCALLPPRREILVDEQGKCGAIFARVREQQRRTEQRRKAGDGWRHTAADGGQLITYRALASRLIANIAGAAGGPIERANPTYTHSFVDFVVLMYEVTQGRSQADANVHGFDRSLCDAPARSASVLPIGLQG